METSLNNSVEWEFRRDTLHQRIAVRLRQMLIQGLLAPGAKLNERELCERLDVSRTPLRESSRLLAAEGLVHRVHGGVTLSAAEDKSDEDTGAPAGPVTAGPRTLGMLVPSLD